MESLHFLLPQNTHTSTHSATHSDTPPAPLGFRKAPPPPTGDRHKKHKSKKSKSKHTAPAAPEHDEHSNGIDHRQHEHDASAAAASLLHFPTAAPAPLDDAAAAAAVSAVTPNQGTIDLAAALAPHLELAINEIISRINVGQLQSTLASTSAAAATAPSMTPADFLSQLRAIAPATDPVAGGGVSRKRGLDGAEGGGRKKRRKDKGAAVEKDQDEAALALIGLSKPSGDSDSDDDSDSDEDEDSDDDSEDEDDSSADGRHQPSTATPAEQQDAVSAFAAAALGTSSLSAAAQAQALVSALTSASAASATATAAPSTSSAPVPVDFAAFLNGGTLPAADPTGLFAGIDPALDLFGYGARSQQPRASTSTSCSAAPGGTDAHSNAEFLKALQALEAVSKTAAVADGASGLGAALGQLGAAGTGAGNKGTGAGGRKKPKKRIEVPVVPLEEQSKEDQDHAVLLATKWLNPTKLAELVKTQGLKYKKGKFSTLEEQQLEDALAQYKAEKRIDDEALREIIFAKGKKAREQYGTFWSVITAAVPQRPIIAVYHHIRRAWHPLKQQGAWSEEEDEKLRVAVLDLGQQWEKVSERVGRMSADCRDRWRNHIKDKDTRKHGPWSREEEDLLTQIVKSLTIDQGKSSDNDVFWSVVSERMGGTRTRQQCRIKWTDALNKKYKNNNEKPRWTADDARTLIDRVAALPVNDDTEIDWKLIPTDDWNLWSAHQLQRRWTKMKTNVHGYEDMSYRELLDTVIARKSQLTSSGHGSGSGGARPSVRAHGTTYIPVMGELVGDEDDDDDDDDDDDPVVTAMQLANAHLGL